MARRVVLVGKMNASTGQHQISFDGMIEQVTVATPACMVCGKTGEVKMPEMAFTRWQNGDFIQNAWPNGPAGLREQLINGTHPACWDKMFPKEDDQ